MSILDIADNDSEDGVPWPALEELGLMGDIESIDDEGEHLTFLGGGDWDSNISSEDMALLKGHFWNNQEIKYD